MASTLTINQYKNVGNWIVNNQKNCRIVPLIWGKHGIGKTQVTEEIAKEHGMNYVVLNLANQTTEDLLGFPDGKGGYILPDWFVTDGTPTLYFLDEINRAPKYVLQAMFNFLNEGRIHKHMINAHDVIIAAANPSDDDYEVTDFEDKAFMSRFGHFYLEPSASEFISYLDTKKCNKGLLAALRTAPDVTSNSVDDEYRIMVTPDNRAIDRVRQMLDLMDDQTFASIGYELMASIVGQDFAQVIKTSIDESKKMQSPESILKVKSSAELMFAEDDLDTITVTNAAIASYIKEAFFKHEKAKLTKGQLKALMVYLNFIPRDAELAFQKDLINATCLSYVRSLFTMEYLAAMFEV